MKIERVETDYYRLPLEAMGDAGHGDINTEELITLRLHAEGLTGHGYSYTIGRGGRAIKSLIDEGIVPMILGHDATDIRAIWDLMWQRLLYVGRGGLTSFAIAAVDMALWDLRGVREDRALYALIPEDAAGHATISREMSVPVAVGESLHSPHEFRRYVDERTAGGLQIDPITNGGITASLQAIEMADETGLATSSHYTDELSAHVLCASDNPVYLEKHAFALDPYLEEPQAVTNGRVRPTESPGTGLRFDAEALAPYLVT
jgi:L-alanine-DL-glutamate epimerase-like enolase superfamily enzyme